MLGKNIAAADLVRKKKIEEDVIKENLSLYGLLQNQAVSLKKQLEGVEDTRLQEKSIFVNLVENFKESLSFLKEKIVQDRKKHEEDNEFYKRILSEKDSQYEKQIRTLVARYESAQKNAQSVPKEM